MCRPKFFAFQMTIYSLMLLLFWLGGYADLSLDEIDDISKETNILSQRKAVISAYWYCQRQGVEKEIATSLSYLERGLRSEFQEVRSLSSYLIGSLYINGKYVLRNLIEGKNILQVLENTIMTDTSTDAVLYAMFSRLVITSEAKLMMHYTKRNLEPYINPYPPSIAGAILGGLDAGLQQAWSDVMSKRILEMKYGYESASSVDLSMVGEAKVQNSEYVIGVLTIPDIDYSLLEKLLDRRKDSDAFVSLLGSELIANKEPAFKNEDIKDIYDVNMLVNSKFRIKLILVFLRAIKNQQSVESIDQWTRYRFSDNDLLAGVNGLNTIASIGGSQGLKCLREMYISNISRKGLMGSAATKSFNIRLFARDGIRKISRFDPDLTIREQAKMTLDYLKSEEENARLLRESKRDTELILLPISYYKSSANSAGMLETKGGFSLGIGASSGNNHFNTQAILGVGYLPNDRKIEGRNVSGISLEISFEITSELYLTDIRKRFIPNPCIKCGLGISRYFKLRKKLLNQFGYSYSYGIGFHVLLPKHIALNLDYQFRPTYFRGGIGNIKFQRMSFSFGYGVLSDYKIPELP